MKEKKEEKQEAMTLRLSPALKERLKKMSLFAGTSQTTFIILAITNELERFEKKAVIASMASESLAEEKAWLTVKDAWEQAYQELHTRKG